MKALKDKVIRDAVHGNIIVTKQYVETILDTDYFQRLRRVEQTSIRALYPSARHDRFIHSLGVYYIGSLFSHQLQKECEAYLPSSQKHQLNKILLTYRAACLLHDIAHAPFSHTFERYFGRRKRLYKILSKKLPSLNLSPEEYKDVKQHEFASALLILNSPFSNVLRRQLQIDVPLACRMIIGAKYNQNSKISQIKDCFIDLLHGSVLDADRVDYACRDVWASGYTTASIDVQRIVAALHIKPIPNNDRLEVCYDYNALTEIVNMLEVRSFQNKYVINHHTVQYEQEILVKAAETMAVSIFGQAPELSLQKVISMDGIINKEDINGVTYTHFSDEDLLYLIKHTPVANPYFEEYQSREYTRFALWKKPEELYYYFPNISRKISISSSVFADNVRAALINTVPNVQEILFKVVTFKSNIKLDDLNIIINGEVKKYGNICPKYFEENLNEKVNIGNKNENKEIEFTYIFIPYPNNGLTLEEYKEQIINQLTPIMKEFEEKEDEVSIPKIFRDASNLILKAGKAWMGMLK